MRWSALAILDRWTNIPAYKNVQIIIDSTKTPPPFNIFHVNGRVAVPKNCPNSDKPIKIRIRPTKTILIKAELLIIYLKSVFDHFQVVFKFWMKE